MIALLFLISLSSQEGKLRLVYEPKHCITDPCPQFNVIEMNSKKPSKIWGADLENFDLDKVYPLQEILVEGRWTQKNDYLTVQIKNWKPVKKRGQKK